MISGDKNKWFNEWNSKMCMDVEKAVEKVERWKSDGRVIVFTNGCFDILHPGHVAYLTEARSLGDKLVIGLNSDASVRRLKGDRRPLNDLEDRMKMLAGLSVTDLMVPFEEDTPLTLISNLKPHVLVKGGDYSIGEIVGSEVVLKEGGKVFSLGFSDNYSTTGLIEKILKSYRDV